MDAQELRNLQEAYMEFVVGELKDNMKTFQEFCLEAYKLPGRRIGFRTLYHGTSSDRAEKIRERGFKSATGKAKRNQPENKTGWAPGRVYATPSKERADKYSKSKIVDDDMMKSGVSKVIDKLRGKKKAKPETLKIAVSSRSDVRKTGTFGDGPKDKEVTISTKTANTGIKNAQALDRMRRGTIRKNR